MDEFIFDGTEESLPEGFRLAAKDEVFYLPGIPYPISNTRGMYLLEIGVRYYVLQSGRIVKAKSIG